MTATQHETLLRSLFPHASGELIAMAVKGRVQLPVNVIRLSTWKDKIRD